MEKEKVESSINLALTLSAQMLKYGGETYRAEDCALRVLEYAGAEDVSVTAIPTNVVVTASFDGNTVTRCRSVRVRSVNLEGIDRINTLSRLASAGKIGFEEATKRATEEGKKRPAVVTVLYSALSSAAFALIFGGGFVELLCALAIAFVSQLAVSLFKKSGKYTFVSNLLCAVFTAICARLLSLVIPDLITASVIIGGIMPLLPGLAMINAIRDTINGDLVSGSARAAEAMLGAVGIAAGVGIIAAI